MAQNASFDVNEDAKSFEETMKAEVPEIEFAIQPGTDRWDAVDTACVVVDAYVNGYVEIIPMTLSRTSAIGAFGEITSCEFPVYYETADGLISAKDIDAIEMVQKCRMEGVDEITGDEPEGTIRTIYIYYRSSEDQTEQYSSYFKVDLIREDGLWKVVRF